MRQKIRYWKGLLILLFAITGTLTDVQAQVFVRRPVARVYHPPVRRVVVAPRPVVVPPVYGAGRFFAVLPAGYTITYVNNIPYYYADGIYYVKTDRPENNEEIYRAVVPPLGTIVPSLPEGSKVVIVDGKNYFRFDDVLYKEIVIEGTIKYVVTGYTD